MLRVGVTKIKTKRFLFSILKNVIENGGFACHSVLGSRKVGKTVLLQQLANDFEDGYYVDISNLSGSLGDFSNFYDSLYEKGIKRVFIDEVCKLTDQEITNFVYATKVCTGYMTVVISGSVAHVIENISDRIGRGADYDLPPFLYIETLCWSGGQEFVSLDYVIKHSSYDSFIGHIKSQNFSNRFMHRDYVKSVVQDTLESCLSRTTMDDSYIELEYPEFRSVLRYISMAQFVYKKDSGVYVNEPTLEESICGKILKDYSNYPRCKNSSISSVCSVLIGCMLARRAGVYRYSLAGVDSSGLADRNVPALVFEYPWLSTVFLSSDILESDTILSLWVENYILIKASYLYYFVDKLMVNNKEVDLVYKLTDSSEGFYGLEVKNRPYNNVQRKYIKKEEHFAKDIGLSSLSFSCSDVSIDNFYKIDNIVAAMELGYCDMVRSVDDYCEYSIPELVEKYFK